MTTNNIKITIAGHSFTIDQPDVSRKEDWNVVKAQELGGDRSEFLIQAFQSEFPKIVLPTNATEALDLISRLGSRNRLIREYMVIASAKYATSASMPGWLKDHVPVSEMAQAEKAITRISVLNSEQAKEEQKLLEDYRLKKKAIELKYDAKLKTERSNNIIKVLSLTSEQAPVSIALAIEGYSPADADASAPNRRLYARELLTNWKISLLQYIQKEPGVDIDKIVEAMKKE